MLFTQRCCNEIKTDEARNSSKNSEQHNACQLITYALSLNCLLACRVITALPSLLSRSFESNFSYIL